MKRKVLVGMTVLLFGVSIWNSNMISNAKTKEVVMVEGANRKISTAYSDLKELTSSNKKKASVKAGDFFVQVKAKKKGTVIISYKGEDASKRKEYSVKILSKKTVKKKAKKELGKVVKGLKQGTGYAYIDFNYDGIEDLYYNGRIAYYNYATNKVVTKNYYFKELYVSKKKKCMLGIYDEKHQRVTDYFVYTCEYFEPNYYKLFKLDASGKGYREYTDAGKTEYSATQPYAYYDTGYDQDDYDYKALSKEDVIKEVKKKMPDCKKVELTIR